MPNPSLPQTSPKSAPRPSPKSPELGDSAFRETFLAQLGDEEIVRDYRRFADAQITLVWEARMDKKFYGPSGGATQGLKAIAADLRYLEAYLFHDVALMAEKNGRWKTPRAQRLYEFAARLASRMGDIADEIDRELEASLLLSDRTDEEDSD